MEADDKDRQREMEEIEEIRRRLGDRAVEPEEEPMVREKNFLLGMSIFVGVLSCSYRMLSRTVRCE